MTTPSRKDVTVVGAGIVGLATALRLAQTGHSVVVCEAESAVAAHQTGRNSGVIHSGLYYRPGSLKARLAVAGRDETVAFCRRHDLPHRIGGKVVVAVEEAERAGLAELARVTRPGGRLVVCEFATPTWGPFAHIYREYLMRALPAIARRVSSNPEAYVYLAESIRAWPTRAELAHRIAAAGWAEVAWRDLTGGIVALHRAARPAARG
jgi:glycine/D-amino acid oxidase-like deaminating enzyme